MSLTLDDFLTAQSGNPTNIGTFWGESMDRSTSGSMTISGNGSAVFANSASVTWAPNDGSVDIPGNDFFQILNNSGGFAIFELTINHSGGTYQVQAGAGSGNDIVWNISGARTGMTSLVLQNLTGSSATMGAAGAEPHVVCLDGSRMDVYHDGIYRFFEDPKHGLVVNIGVQNTYITFATVLDARSNTTVAHVHFNIDHNRQLHANSLELVEGTGEWCEDNNQSIAIRVGDYEIKMETKYRTVSVGNAKWRPGQTHLLGGVLASTLMEPANANDNKPGPVHQTTLNKYTANALSCDAHFPHIVSFFGSSVIPGPATEVTPHNFLLFDGVSILAQTDAFSRLTDLELRVNNVLVHRAKWTRQNADASPDQNSAPNVKMIVDSVVVEDCGGVVAATQCVDFIAPFHHGGELLVRLQANGAASFAIREVDVDVFRKDATGFLVNQSSSAMSQKLASGTAASSTSVYENVIEPHLAWAKGKQTGETKRVGGIRAA